jgi:AraC-like DNA-binding protein
VDLLTDVLQQAGLHRRLLDLRRLREGAPLRFPCDKSIGLHVVTQGQLFLHSPGLEQPLALGRGDIAVMARGCHHVLSLQPQWREAEVVDIQNFPRSTETDSAADDTATTVISGAYQLWHRPVHPLFRDLPPWFVLRAEALPRLGSLALTTSLLDQELRHHGMGASAIVHGLLDALFSYALRELLARKGEAHTGWAMAVRAAPVRQAIHLMHADAARNWTLDELAREVGLSRTGLAERFRKAMGDTPLSHLRTLRMQKAMHLLSETERPLDQVAEAVGYSDAFGFSKVFKREVGLSPRDFRRQDAADRQSPWRVQAG